jgi:hypothetical protein
MLGSSTVVAPPGWVQRIREIFGRGHGSSAWAIRDFESAMNTALEQQETNEADPDLHRRRAIAAEMAEMGHRAQMGFTDNWHTNYLWSGASVSSGMVTVITSAVGASVLVSPGLSGSSKWIVGGAALVGTVISGWVTVVNPGGRYATAWMKARAYEGFWRQVKQYSCTTLPTADLTDASNRLEQFRKDLQMIIESGGPVRQDPTRPK